jgi:hypothetical protein
MDSVVEVFAGKVKTKSRSGHTLAGAALSHKTLTMTRLAPTLIRSFFTILAVIAFSAFIFGQPNLVSGPASENDPLKIIGWIAIITAAATHTAMNIYNLIRGKNYEQLKETAANYKELAESRKAQLSECNAESHVKDAHIDQLELALERAKEKELRL